VDIAAIAHEAVKVFVEKEQKQSFTAWTFFSVFMGIPSWRADRIALDPVACIVSTPAGAS
jgi:hypothetical protein